MIDVSVIIPTYRREKLVPEAISSAISQQGVELEVIVVDDCPDGSARMAVEQFRDDRVRYTQMVQPSEGRIGRVYNEGAARANGRFLHFLDDDDRLAYGALMALVITLSHYDAGVAFGRIKPFGSKPALVEKMRVYYERAAAAGRRIGSNRYAFASRMLFAEWPLVSSACMIRLDVFNALGGRDKHVKLYDDIEFYLRAGRESGVTFVDRDVLHYRVGSPSMTNSLLELDDVPQIRQEYKKLQQDYRSKHGIVEYRALQALAKLIW